MIRKERFIALILICLAAHGISAASPDWIVVGGPQMSTARYRHTATLLQDGRIHEYLRANLLSTFEPRDMC